MCPSNIFVVIFIVLGANSDATHLAPRHILNLQLTLNIPPRQSYSEDSYKYNLNLSSIRSSQYMVFCLQNGNLLTMYRDFIPERSSHIIFEIYYLFFFSLNSSCAVIVCIIDFTCILSLGRSEWNHYANIHTRTVSLQMHLRNTYFTHISWLIKYLECHFSLFQSLIF